MTDVPEKKSNDALGKAFEVLGHLARSDQPLSLMDIVARTGRPKQTLHRILGQLESLGMVNRELSGKRYRLGPGMMRLSSDVLSAAFRGFPRHLILRDLVDALGESCNIGLLDQASVLYLDRVECEWPLRWHLKPGSRVPLHSTSLGKLLLAGLPAPDRRRLIARLPLERFTERTIVDPLRLEEECRKIRSDGFASNNQESHAGLISVAVPIPIRAVSERSETGLVGLAVHAPMVRLGLEAAREKIPVLRRYAEKLAKDWHSELLSC